MLLVNPVPPPSFPVPPAFLVFCHRYPATGNHETAGTKRWPKWIAPPDCRKPRNMGTIEMAMRNSKNRSTEFIFEPILGMVFDSRAEAYQFYNLYSWEADFSNRFGTSSRNRGNKYGTMQELVCEREVMIHTGATRIPECHIMKRWKRFARDTLYPDLVGQDSESVADQLKQNLLYGDSLDLVRRANKDSEIHDTVAQNIRSAKQEIERLMEWRSKQPGTDEDADLRCLSSSSLPTPKLHTQLESEIPTVLTIVYRVQQQLAAIIYIIQILIKTEKVEQQLNAKDSSPTVRPGYGEQWSSIAAVVDRFLVGELAPSMDPKALSLELGDSSPALETRVRICGGTENSSLSLQGGD
ncbi:hypothetical protein EJB05_54662, partial [Eragrostis curvula]